MKYRSYITLVAGFAFIAFACQKSHEIKVEVSGDNFNTTSYMIELNAREILSRLGSNFCFVTNDLGKEIPSQITYDSLLVFKTPLNDTKSMSFIIHPSDSLHQYKNLAWGQFYPKRRDDLSYENELGGFRIYGPGTQAAGEKSFGYDIFFKYTTESLIVPDLYNPETSDEVWAKVDSLREIDNQLAEDFITSFSYHIDHGKGMDSFAVGATLGAGVPAILTDEIIYPWCYESAEILDNGPLRFTYVLRFPEVELPDGRKVIENRLTSLEAGSYLNKSKVWYENLGHPSEIVVGFPLRDDTPYYSNSDDGILVYAAPAQQLEYGKALLGIKLSNTVDSVIKKDNHILLASTLSPSDSLTYKWGFSWDKTEISDQETWIRYIQNFNSKPEVKIIY